MINLLPTRGHTALKHEYVLRVASVYGFLLSGVFLASTALLLPTYALTSTQRGGAEHESSDIEETKAAFEAAFGEIKVANTILAQLSKPSDDILYSEVIEEVVRLAPGGISFSAFTAAREGVVLREMQVQGRAENRLALASFKEKLEASPLFTKAFVPISDLARDTDLTFVVTLTLGEEEAGKTQ